MSLPVIIFLSVVMLPPLLLAWLRRGPVLTPWFIALALLGGLLVWLLKANAIPPKTWYGVAAHAVLLFTMVSLTLVTAFLFHGYSPKSALKDKAPGIKILAAWGLMVVSLLSLEVFFRITPVHDTSAANAGVKFFWPDWVYHPLNNFGYREQPFDVNKTADTYRILLVGDSYVEGAGLNRQQTLGFRLEQELNRSTAAQGEKGRAQVYNLAHCGNNTQEEVADILKFAPQLKPDMIILAYVLNDPELHAPEVSLQLTNPPPWAKKLRNLFFADVRSYAFYWFYTHFSWFRTQYTSLEDILVALHQKDYPGWKVVVDSLNTLVSFLRSNGFDGMAIIFPFIMGPTYSRSLRDLHEQVRLTMEGSGLDVVDLLPVSEKEIADLSKLRFSSYDSHPNAVATRIWGKYLAEIIRPRPSYVNWRRAIAN